MSRPSAWLIAHPGRRRVTPRSEPRATPHASQPGRAVSFPPRSVLCARRCLPCRGVDELGYLLERRSRDRGVRAGRRMKGRGWRCSPVMASDLKSSGEGLRFACRRSPACSGTSSELHRAAPSAGRRSRSHRRIPCPRARSRPVSGLGLAVFAPAPSGGPRLVRRRRPPPCGPRAGLPAAAAPRSEPSANLRPGERFTRALRGPPRNPP